MSHEGPPGGGESLDRPEDVRLLEFQMSHAELLREVGTLEKAERKLKVADFPLTRHCVVLQSDQSGNRHDYGVMFISTRPHNPDRPLIRVVPVARGFGMDRPRPKRGFNTTDADLIHTLATELMTLKTTGELPNLSSDLSRIIPPEHPAGGGWSPPMPPAPRSPSE